jgi:hypothetical protein
MAKDIMVTVVQSAVTATLIGLAIAGMKRQKYKEAMTLQSGAKMMRAPTSMWLLSYGSLLFWIALIVLSSMFPGKTKDLLGRRPNQRPDMVRQANHHSHERNHESGIQ